MKLAAFAFAAFTLATICRGAVHATAAPPTSTPAPQKIAVDARGPLVLVEVTRTVVPEPAEGTGGNEALLDLALPDGSALVSVDVRDGGRWRRVDPAAEGGARAAEAYRAESAARGVTPTSEPYDDSATHRLHLLRSAGHGAGAGTAPFAVRYRFAVLPEGANGRLRVRFPAATERLPPAAEVTLRLAGAADADIAGLRIPLGAGADSATGRASTRSAWEILWTPRAPVASGAPPLEARVAVAPLGRERSGTAAVSALAFTARRRQGPSRGLPGSVLFLVDRSRSVGLPGLSAERDLVRALIEALPPSTRFDALFFDRGTKRLFPMSRPATREAIEGFEAEMVPDRLQNGTDLPGALREAGALLRREATTFGPRTLLVLVTDGALGDEDGAALDRALGNGLGGAVGNTTGGPAASTPGLDVALAALTLRAVDDESAGLPARDALRALAAARGGVARQLRASEIGDGVLAALADLQHGGDLGAIRLIADGVERRISESLTPGALLAGVVPWKGRPPHAVRLEAVARGQRIAVASVASRIAPEWLRPWVVFPAASASANPIRFLSLPSLVALVEPVLHSTTTTTAASEVVVKGSMDRMVIRNVLSLAYMPRARACYLNRTAATPALRDLTGKVRLAIELARGEVGGVKIESSTLGNPEVERCLRESAFEIEVPRAARSDAPVTAVLNMVFRPRSSDKKPDVDLGEVGNEIDLVIEEMHRREASTAAVPPVP